MLWYRALGLEWRPHPVNRLRFGIKIKRILPFCTDYTYKRCLPVTNVRYNKIDIYGVHIFKKEVPLNLP